jgi:disulfide bond formation protein DsbB
MSYEQMRAVFTVLTVVANLVVLGHLAAWGLRAVPSVARLRSDIYRSLAGREIPFAFAVALVATAGSLYLSEIVDLVPCELCWFQRVLMYPLVVLFGIAWWRRDNLVGRYAAPLAAIGLAVSSYHYLLQRFPGLEGGACSIGIPCSSAYFWMLGFISIPYMAGSAFALMLVLIAVRAANTAGAPAETSEVQT